MLCDRWHGYILADLDMTKHRYRTYQGLSKFTDKLYISCCFLKKWVYRYIPKFDEEIKITQNEAYSGLAEYFGVIFIHIQY